MNIYFKEVNHGACFQLSEFCVEDIHYTIIFQQVTPTILEDDIADIVRFQERIFTVQFVVSDYLLPEYEGDLYLPPVNKNIARKTINILKTQLQKLLYAHYKRYHAQCYVFHAVRPSLGKLYEKMCINPAENLIKFSAFSGLGIEKNGFVLKTPQYQEIKEIADAKSN